MFDKKSIIITGAGSGIGRSTALLLASQGGQIVVSDINEEGGLETVEMIKKQGGEAHFVVADVADYQAVKQLTKATVERYGKIDIAINNAGIAGQFQRTDLYDHALYNKVIAINQTGVFYCMQQQLRQMTKQGNGVIINVSSMAGLRGQAFASPYVASKHAVLGFTKSAALEFARYNIRINAVCPVYTQTPLVEKLLEENPAIGPKLLKAIPMRRWGQPGEVAQAIAWLSSEQAAFSTGLCLPVDGGLCC